MKSPGEESKSNNTLHPPRITAGGITDIAVWDRPDSNWNRAALRTPQADPFCCRTEWQFSFHEAMQPGRRLVVRETPGSVVAFAENPRSPLGPLLVPVEAGWKFGCPLLGPDAVELLDEMLGEARPGAMTEPVLPALVISGVQPRSNLLRQLVAKFRTRFEFHRIGSSILCGASLAGGLDGFLARRSGTHRRGLRKQGRRADRAGVTFARHVPRDGEAAGKIYARMLAVEESSWKGIGHCGMTAPPSRGYYACMLRRLAVSGGGRVMFARHGGRDICFIFGGLAGEVYRGQQFSYADGWKAESIGNLLQLEQIRWLCEEGVSRYDMGPLMGYKDHWTEHRTPIETWLLTAK